MDLDYLGTGSRRGVCTSSKMFMVKEYKLVETTEKLKSVEGGTDSGGLVSVIHHNARGKTESWSSFEEWKIMGNAWPHYGKLMIGKLEGLAIMQGI